MRINNNLQAANATRQLNVNSGSASKSMEKLSSGYRINRAGDDAAGLAISEKMRGQIRGLNQASKNSQEGISLIQTAEGGLNETHSILQRMRELAVQASTGTLQDEDRGQINKEFDALSKEVDDIAGKTQFNKMNLLDGTFGASIGDATTLQTAEYDADGALKAGTVSGLKAINLDGTAKADTYNITEASGTVTITSTTLKDTEGAFLTEDATLTDGKFSFTKLGITLEATAATDTADLAGKNIIVKKDGVNLQTGANKGDTLAVAIADMSTTGLGLTGVNTNDTDSATNAIEKLEGAIKTVSDERAKLGATQNRLEYKIKNLNSSSENLQSAESNIRDVDMASEMVEYTKNDILQQAAQAMLAKANQAPQSILQLLR